MQTEASAMRQVIETQKREIERLKKTVTDLQSELAALQMEGSRIRRSRDAERKCCGWRRRGPLTTCHCTFARRPEDTFTTVPSTTKQFTIQMQCGKKSWKNGALRIEQHPVSRNSYSTATQDKLSLSRYFPSIEIGLL